MEKLKPCPFCGDEHPEVVFEEIAGVKLFSVRCDFCGAESGNAKNKRAVISKWNSREEIYSCPFCGANASLCECESGGERYFVVNCEECGATTTGIKDEAEAIRAWKHRI